MKDILVFLTTCKCTSLAMSEVLSVPEECKGMQYCVHKPDGYDRYEEQMNSILRQFIKEDTTMRFKRSNLDEVHQRGFNKTQLSTSDSIQLTTLSPKSDWHNCPYKMQRRQFYLINGFYVVQTKELRQIFKIVTCANEYVRDSDEQCHQDFPLKKLGLKSEYETIFSWKSAYIYDIEQNKIAIKYFELPVSCFCKVTRKL